MVSYIESASGVAVGGRTGLAALVTAALFLVAMFFSPVVQMISGGFAVHDIITV
jgi:AGZA family xanthine/uracil permease-like MFS transporter